MLGAATNGAYTQGVKNLGNIFALNQAMQQAKRNQLAQTQLGDYMQSMVPPPPQPPAPGAASVPMSQPASSAQSSAQPQDAPKSMSLDGLMAFLKTRGIEGQDAFATAEQFSPYLAAEDRQKLGQQKFQVDMEKLLIANGFDEAKAKNEAARIGAYRERTKAMYGKGGTKDQVQALSHTVQQLTVGRQKLSQQASTIVNNARNAGRMMTPQEQATVTAINAKIQTVDNGMAAARQQQALLTGGLNYGAQPDSMGQADTSTSAAGDVDTSDMGDDGSGGS